MEDKYNSIIERIIQFRDEREWKQFHDPKNLSEAICIESGELLEKFLWNTTEASRTLSKDKLDEIEEEVADIMIFLIYFCDSLDISLFDAVERKIEKNRNKYPRDKSKGTSKKYTEL